MKKLFSVLVLTLAVNFLVVAGAVGYLVQQKKLTRESIAAIKDVLFAPPAEPAPATLPAAEDPTTRPSLKLEELLAKRSGQSATEQAAFIQQTFDAQLALLDRRQRELLDQKALIAKAAKQLTRDRQELERQKHDLSDKQAQATKLADNKGFQDSLQLYNTLPAKQVKTIFMGLDESTMQMYLQAMTPRTATKIVKEFKSPDELARVQKVLEQMRLNQLPPSASANTPASAERP